MGNRSAMSREFRPASAYPPDRPNREPSAEQQEEDKASRITPVMPIPDWLREIDERNPSGQPETALEEEHGFWNAPPRYSVTGLSLMPDPIVVPAPPRVRVWSARVLFSAILCAVVMLLGVEASSVVHNTVEMRALAGSQK